MVCGECLLTNLWSSFSLKLLEHKLTIFVISGEFKWIKSVVLVIKLLQIAFKSNQNISWVYNTRLLGFRNQAVTPFGKKQPLLTIETDGLELQLTWKCCSSWSANLTLFVRGVSLSGLQNEQYPILVV